MKTLVKIIFPVLALAFLAGNAEAQTCNSNIPGSAPDYRFVDNGNGTVTDLWTGLMWKQCVEGMVTDGSGGCIEHTDTNTYTWADALQRAAAVNSGTAGERMNWGDWRLPNLKELYSITEQSCESPTINENYFPLTYNPPLSNFFFWSSTQYAFAGAGIWFVGFTVGNLTTTGPSNLWHVRLVRSVQ